MHSSKWYTVLFLAGLAHSCGPGVALAQEFEVSRAQVKAELREAQRLGLMGCGDNGCVATPEQNQMIANAGRRAIGEEEVPLYTPAQVTRAQVKAEFRTAAALGLLPKGDGEARTATAEEQREIEEARRRAAPPIGVAFH